MVCINLESNKLESLITDPKKNFFGYQMIDVIIFSRSEIIFFDVSIIFSFIYTYNIRSSIFSNSVHTIMIIPMCTKRHCQTFPRVFPLESLVMHR